MLYQKKDLTVSFLQSGSWANSFREINPTWILSIGPPSFKRAKEYPRCSATSTIEKMSCGAKLWEAIVPRKDDSNTKSMPIPRNAMSSKVPTMITNSRWLCRPMVLLIHLRGISWKKGVERAYLWAWVQTVNGISLSLRNKLH